MRRLMVIPIAGLLILAVAAPVAAKPNVSNTSGSSEAIYGEFSDGTTYGYLYLEEENGAYAWGEFVEESGDWVVCLGGTEEDGPYGFQGSRTSGWANDLEISISRRLNAAAATGVLDLLIEENVDDCAGTADVTWTTASFSVELTGTGPIGSFRGSGSYKIPSEYNEHGRSRGKDRAATGSLDLGSLGTRDLDYAVMSQFSWSSHVNH